jgi:hypothetical protein
VVINERARRLDAYVEQHGVLVVFILHLIPLFSFDAISYAAGLSSMRFGKFFLATAPGIFAFIYLGGASPGFGLCVVLKWRDGQEADASTSQHRRTGVAQVAFTLARAGRRLRADPPAGAGRRFRRRALSPLDLTRIAHEAADEERRSSSC